MRRAALSEPTEASRRVVVIGVDDESYRNMNRAWPWGRDVFAALLDELALLEPQVIGLDFMFVGKSPDPQADEWLRSAIAKCGNVILCSYFSNTNPPLYVPSLESLRSAASGSGFVDKLLDRDAVNRRTRVRMPLAGGEQVHSFSSRVAYAALGADPAAAIDQEERRVRFARVGASPGGSALADRNGFIWLTNRYRPEVFDYVPAWKIIAKQVDPAMIRGRIVLLGAVSPTFHDNHQTPLGVLSGVFINANEIASILGGDFLRTGALEREWIVLLALTVLFTAVFNRLSFFNGFWVLLAVGPGLWAVSQGLFSWGRVLVEPFSPVFVLVLTYAIVMGHRSLRTMLENVALQRLVVTDALTGLYGYRYLSLRLEKIWSTKGPEFCYVMMDVDSFKRVNDSYGHERGNEVLVEIAKLLKGGVRSNDIVARYGGDEFCFLLLNCTGKAAVQTAEKIREAVRRRVFSDAKGDFSVTVSAGICSSRTPQAHSVDDLIGFADNALYEAKQGGRDRTRVYGDADGVKGGS